MLSTWLVWSVEMRSSANGSMSGEPVTELQRDCSELAGRWPLAACPVLCAGTGLWLAGALSTFGAQGVVRTSISEEADWEEDVDAKGTGDTSGLLARAASAAVLASADSEAALLPAVKRAANGMAAWSASAAGLKSVKAALAAALYADCAAVRCLGAVCPGPGPSPASDSGVVAGAGPGAGGTAHAREVTSVPAPGPGGASALGT